MSVKSSYLLLTIVGLSYWKLANGWGQDGHALVARIAQTLLTDQSLVFVQNHLPWYTNGNISMLASWPDYIIYPDTNPVDYLNWQWSKQLHYADTDDWSCVYDRDRNCQWNDSRRCVDGSIQNYTNRLSDREQNDEQREQALKFLIHFIGDAHQPLHAGFRGDEGGNLLKGKFFEKETNLHTIWDTDIIQRRVNEDFHSQPSLFLDYLLDQMKSKYAANISEWTNCSGSDESRFLACAQRWISEDAKLNCDLVYRDENNQPMNISKQFELGSVYYNTRLTIVEQRLVQAGIRLATVINEIVDFNDQNRSIVDNADRSLFLILFIVLLAFSVCLVFGYLTIIKVRRNKSNYQPQSDSIL